MLCRIVFERMSPVCAVDRCPARQLRNNRWNPCGPTVDTGPFLLVLRSRALYRAPARTTGYSRFPALWPTSTGRRTSSPVTSRKPYSTDRSTGAEPGSTGPRQRRLHLPASKANPLENIPDKSRGWRNPPFAAPPWQQFFMWILFHFLPYLLLLHLSNKYYIILNKTIKFPWS